MLCQRKTVVVLVDRLILLFLSRNNGVQTASKYQGSAVTKGTVVR